ncbi:MAG TPA: cellulase family glycosylhydrolase, partial [Clostridia bacterium]|nr:cellulase family glycosylhydrolase [Clostridia bacterium]
GANATRYLLLPTYCASIRDEALQALTLPDDDRLIVSVHLYEPYAFALQENGTSHWDPDRDADTKPIREAIANLQKRFIDRGIPVLITEYGAMDKHNEAARVAWANYVGRLAGTANIRCIWWDTSLLEAETLTWRSPNLLRALTQTSESSKGSP